MSVCSSSTHRWQSRRRVMSLAGAALLLGLAACGGSGDAGQEGDAAAGAELTFGTQPVIAYGLFQVAADEGYFEAEGVAVELVSFDSGSPELEAMSGGSIDAGTMGATPVLVAAAQGLIKDLRVVSITDNPSNGYSILSDASITSVADLAGKTVAGTAGSNYQYFLNRALAKFGLSEGDVEFVNSEPADAQAAFIAGRVDAIVPPESARFLIPERRPDTNVLFTAEQFTEGPGSTEPFDVYDVIVAPASVVEEDGEALSAFLRAFHGPTVDQLRESPEQTYAAVTEWLNSSGQAGVEQEAVESQFTVSEFYSAEEALELMEGDRVSSSLQQQFDFLLSIDRASGELDVETLLDPRALQQASEQ